MTKIKERSEIHWIPIYNISFEVVLTDNVYQSRNQKKRVRRLGGKHRDNAAGLVSFLADKVSIDMSLFLARYYLTHRLISHEIRHAVDDILSLRDVNPDVKVACETTALLTGHVAELVYRDLKAWRAKIR